MATIAELQAQIDALKATVSGKIEYNNESASFRVALATMVSLFLERGVAQVQTVEELQALTSVETLTAALMTTASTGIYTYRTGAITPNGTTKFASADGGFWVKNDVVAP